MICIEFCNHKYTVFRVKVNRMAMNYDKLWKLLIDKKMIKKDLREMAGLSTNVIAKMGKGGDVSTEVLCKICTVLNCRLEDIVEIVPDHKNNKNLQKGN